MNEYECPDIYQTLHGKENYQKRIKYLHFRRHKQMALGKRKRSNTYSIMVRGKQVKVPVARFKNAMGSIPRAPFATRGFFGPGLWRGNRPELKTIDSGDLTFAALDSSNGNGQLLNGVITGSDYNTRIGRTIIMKSLLLRIQWYPLVSVTDSNGDVVRCLIVLDSQPNGTTPTITDILQTASYLAPNNLSNRSRFTTLYDKSLTMTGWTQTAGALVNGQTQPVIRKVYKKMNQEVVYNGTGATIASIQTGGLYFWVIPATNATTGLIFNARVRFTDK